MTGTLRPRESGAATPEGFWEQLAHALARLHTTTVHDKFGWEHDNWLGRCWQHKAWTADGYEFFAQHRLLRWLPERRVQAALDERDRRTLERPCERAAQRAAATARLPDPRRSTGTHNVLATENGLPALIDPAVSYM